MKEAGPRGLSSKDRQDDCTRGQGGHLQGSGQNLPGTRDTSSVDLVTQGQQAARLPHMHSVTRTLHLFMEQAKSQAAHPDGLTEAGAGWGVPAGAKAMLCKKCGAGRLPQQPLGGTLWV